MENYYEIIGVEPDASFEEIKKSYRQLLLKRFPDKVAKDPNNPNHEEETRERYRSLQRAWEVLSDSDTRGQYDACWRQRNLVQDWPIQDSVSFAEFEEDESGVFTYGCRCGDVYVLNDNDVTFRLDIVSCPSCSLCIQVLFIDEDIDQTAESTVNKIRLSD